MAQQGFFGGICEGIKIAACAKIRETKQPVRKFLMELRSEHITVTVFSRREFVLDAIRSALNQTVPVKVIVVEDCGPDSSIRDLIVGKFGNRIEYFRNPRNRDLFDNWNACMEYCRTPWLSILHDDDLLHPNFVETMLALAKDAPDRALYFGRSANLTEDGEIHPAPPASWRGNWHGLDVIQLADECFVWFPGQLIRAGAVREVGGFRPVSYFTGDWDMWLRLTLRFDAAQSATEVSAVRSHYGRRSRHLARRGLDINSGRNIIHSMNSGKSQLTVKAAAYPLSRSPYCRGEI